MKDWKEVWIPGYACKTRAKVVETQLQLQASDDVLHVGCGSGKFLRAIYHRVKTVAGLDRSTAHIRQACFRCRRLNDHAGVRLRAGSVRKMPWSDNSYSAIFSDAVMETSINPEEHMRECFRLLRPGGRLLIRIEHHAFHPPASRALREKDHAFHHYTPESLQYRAEQVGFTPLPMPHAHALEGRYELWLLAQKPLAIVAQAPADAVMLSHLPQTMAR